jgi:hypothetical protein
MNPYPPWTCRLRRRVIGRFGGEDERHRGQRAGVVLSGINCPTGLVNQQLGAVQSATASANGWATAWYIPIGWPNAPRTTA